MAIYRDRHPKNVPGQFYIDAKSCAVDATCWIVAPQNFEYDEDSKQFYVCKQPENLEEFRQVYDAITGCSVEAVGDDGPKNERMSELASGIDLVQEAEMRLLESQKSYRDTINSVEDTSYPQKHGGLFTRLIRKIMS